MPILIPNKIPKWLEVTRHLPQGRNGTAHWTENGLKYPMQHLPRHMLRRAMFTWNETWDQYEPIILKACWIEYNNNLLINNANKILESLQILSLPLPRPVVFLPHPANSCTNHATQPNIPALWHESFRRLKWVMFRNTMFGARSGISSILLLYICYYQCQPTEMRRVLPRNVYQ